MIVDRGGQRPAGDESERCSRRQAERSRRTRERWLARGLRRQGFMESLRMAATCRELVPPAESVIRGNSTAADQQGGIQTLAYLTPEPWTPRRVDAFVRSGLSADAECRSVAWFGRAVRCGDHEREPVDRLRQRRLRRHQWPRPSSGVRSWRPTPPTTLAMATFLAEGFDVGAARLRHPQAVQGQQRHQRMITCR